MESDGRLADPDRLAELLRGACGDFGKASRTGGHRDPECPYCGGVGSRWGRSGACRRYRCRRCRRTFGAATSSPIARSGLAMRSVAVVDALLRPVSIRKVARELGVAPHTALRWRRRILDALVADRPRVCSGEVHVAWMLRIFGQYPSMIVAIDEAGSFIAMTLPWPADVPRLAGMLQRYVAPGSTIVASGGVPRALPRAAQRAGLDYRIATTDGPALIRMRQLRLWLRQFRRIHWRSLPAYLAWHDLLHSAWEDAQPSPRPGPIRWMEAVAAITAVGRTRALPPGPSLRALRHPSAAARLHALTRCLSVLSAPTAD
jgi:transposase-like protein